MDKFNEYKTNDLLELLEFLEKEERLSLALFIRKEEIRKIIAKKLKISVEDAIKLSTKKKIEEEQKRMKKHYQNQIRLSLDKIQKQLQNLDEKLDNLKNGNGN